MSWLDRVHFLQIESLFVNIRNQLSYAKNTANIENKDNVSRDL